MIAATEPSVLIVEDEPSIRDLIVSDIHLGGQRDGGLQVMAAGVLSPDAVVVALTACPDEGNRNALMR